jgi:NADPH:quinone reductase-like Zn-dependent oxidoreductase
MARMKVAQVSKAKGDFEIVEREIPSPGPGQVRIKVQACGVCHSDLYTKDGLWPGLPYPRIPGHEIAGVIDEVGSGVPTWKKGDREGSAGTAVRTTLAPHVARAILSIAKAAKLPASVLTAAIRNIWSLPSKPLRAFRMNWIPRKPHPFYVQE